jgi:hypothetical protein
MTKVILAVATALMLSSGIAHADSNDDDFLRALHKQGIKGTDQALIKIGHVVCDDELWKAARKRHVGRRRESHRQLGGSRVLPRVHSVNMVADTALIP